MADQRQPDGAPDENDERASATTERLLAGPDVLDAPLPDDVQAALGRLLATDSAATLREWADELTSFTGGSLDVEDLCHSAEPTSHYGETGGDRHYFACFYDAVVLAALTDAEVAVHTESPTGTPVEATATADGDVTTTPDGALVSFGVDESVKAPTDREPTHADVYAAVCPYVRAFPDAEAYDRWAAETDAATVAVPLADATAFTDALVG